MQTFSEGFVGTDGGPPSASAYKRAVYRQAPRHFTVEVLDPQKQGNSYSYGLRITPVQNESSDRHSMISGLSGVSGNSSGSSGSSGSISGATTAPLTTEYEVWRRWEDCLYFQDLLETQYALMSREKRARLHAGKGVKKNGVYPHEDPQRLHRAASFESLPPGPDPTMIAKDVHEFLPRLTKKGTLFKASKDTVLHRAAEFRKLIETLLLDGEDVPTLITELRQLRAVRDFFGFWRRDHDRVEKSRDKSSMRGRSDSIGSTSPGGKASSVFASSSFGMYFSASNLSLQLPATPFSLPSEAFAPDRLPRRPPIMQGGKGAMLPTSPISPTASEPMRPSTSSSNATLQVPRQRAQTMQGTGTSGSTNPLSNGYAGSGRSMRSANSLGKPPASAPAGVSFTFTMSDSEDNSSVRIPEEGGYHSDTVSVTDSMSSTQTYVQQRPPRTPRSAPPAFASANGRIANSSFSPTTKGKGRGTDLGEPIIVKFEDEERLDVPMDEGGVPFDEDESILVMREHEHLMPRSLDPLPEDCELELNVARRRLQDLTIEEEEDNFEEYSTADDQNSDHTQSEYHRESTNTDSMPDMILRESAFFDEEPISSESTQPQRRVVSPGSSKRNRNSFFYVPSPSADHRIDDNDASSPTDGRSMITIDRSRSPALSTSGQRAHTPVTPARMAARADALSVLTSDHLLRMRSGSPSPSPASARLLTPSPLSTQSSARTSGSSSSARTTSIDSQTSSGVHGSSALVPMSVRSSIVSCGDIGDRLNDSPIVLHTPLFEQTDEFDLDGTFQEAIERGGTPNPTRLSDPPRMHRPHGSVTSMQSFMTDCSADAVIPRDARAASPPHAQQYPEPGANPRRSLSSDSRRSGRMSQMSRSSRDLPLDGNDNELLDSYFYGVSSSPTTQDGLHETSGREHVRGTLANPGKFPKSFQNRPAGQFHLPWSPSQTPLPNTAGSRSSMLSMDSSISPSTASVLIDEANAVAIKAVFGDHIIAFRADRGIALDEVRAKLYHKLVNQQGVKLSDRFALTYRPASMTRVQKLGRARSNSASSVGVLDPGSLRIIFSQKDWQNALHSCGPKLTLHVLNA